MAQFYTLLTDVGQAKLANAIALGQTIEITELAVGDGNGTLPPPDSTATALVNEVRRAPINTSITDPDNPNWIVVEQVLPPDVGGWTVREIGIFDVDGDMIGVGNYPETYKPVLSEGSSRTQTVRFVLEVSDTAAVTLKVDPSVVLATRQYVDDGDTATAQAAATALQQHTESRNHPPATTTALGFVKKATLEEAKSGAPDKFPDAAAMKAALAAAGYQFAKYDPDRTYETGETCRGSDGHFYEFYDRDGDGTVVGVDPTDPLNRPHIWMRWDGVRPATVIEWRSETLPEGYVTLIGDDISRNDYRRIFDAWGTTHGEGDGVATFGTPNDNDNFKRGWDFGASGRGLAEHQSYAIENITGAASISDDSTTVGAIGSAYGAFQVSNNTGRVPNWSTSSVAGNRYSGLMFDASQAVNTAEETRPSNNAVIYLAKI